jgi:hypothetical protein
VVKYEITEVHLEDVYGQGAGGVFRAGYTITKENGHEEKHVSGPIFACDELEAYMMIKEALEKKCNEQE